MTYDDLIEVAKRRGAGAVMTYDDLIEVAKRRGRLLWPKSGIVEIVHLGKGVRKLPRGQIPIVVARIGTGKKSALHAILPHKRDGTVYLCSEVPTAQEPKPPQS